MAGSGEGILNCLIQSRNKKRNVGMSDIALALLVYGYEKISAASRVVDFSRIHQIYLASTLISTTINFVSLVAQGERAVISEIADDQNCPPKSLFLSYCNNRGLRVKGLFPSLFCVGVVVFTSYQIMIGDSLITLVFQPILDRISKIVSKHSDCTLSVPLMAVGECVTTALKYLIRDQSRANPRCST